jgi:hypothetical protein
MLSRYNIVSETDMRQALQRTGAWRAWARWFAPSPRLAEINVAVIVDSDPHRVAERVIASL